MTGILGDAAGDMRRRTFLGGAAATALAGFLSAYAAGTKETAVGGTLPAWRKGHFTVHFIYTGVAESLFLVFPDGTTLLLDCGDHAAYARGRLAVPILPSMGKHSGEWIARYVKRVNPGGSKVDYALLTHYHSDHAGNRIHAAGLSADGSYVLSGFAQTAEYLSFGTFIDRAYPTFDDPWPVSDRFDNGVVGNLKGLYRELLKRGTKIERFRLETGSNQLKPLHGAVSGFRVVPLCANGRLLRPDGTILDLYGDYLRAERPQEPNENPFSIGLRFEYGPFRFYTAGDFSDNLPRPDGTLYPVEDAMAEICGPCQVAKINHHGYKSMSPKLVAALRSRVYVACIWDQLHVLRETMRRLADPKSYPGPRTICPTVFTLERAAEDRGEPWLATVPSELRTGAHIVLDVPPGGETYTITFVDARDESMRVKSVLSLSSLRG